MKLSLPCAPPQLHNSGGALSTPAPEIDLLAEMAWVRKLAWRHAKKFWLQQSRIDYDDYVQEGFLGLMRAAESFDPSRGIKFNTYATYWVRHAMLEAHTRQGCGMRTRAIIHKSISPCSIDAPIAPAAAKSAPIASVVPDKREPRPDWRIQLREACERVRGILPPTELAIVCRRAKGEKLREIAARSGVSRQRVHQIERAAQDRCRAALPHLSPYA